MFAMLYPAPVIVLVLLTAVFEGSGAGKVGI